jgi:polyvinyl alcohol dehydrogenase (cytochrome)
VRRSFGHGTALGGIHWGMATDGERVFVPINDPYFPENNEYAPQPGLNAVDIDTGRVLWEWRAQPDCSPERQARSDACDARYGLSAAVLSVDQSVIAAGIDGRIYIHDAGTGAVIWEYDSLRDFDTLNGVPGKGGGVDSHSIAAGGGMVFSGSGYGAYQQPRGNVLLAFKPRSHTP